MNLTNPDAIFNTSKSFITNFGYNDNLTYNIASLITSQHIQDKYFIIIVYGSRVMETILMQNCLYQLISDYSKIDIIADNNFTASGDLNHGTMKIDEQQLTIPLSGYTITPKNSGEQLILEAVSNQNDNQGNLRIWNTLQCNRSEWDRDNQFRSFGQRFPFNVSSADDNSRYVAQLAAVHVTTSGALQSNETWFTNVTLTGNVTVPSGKTLILTSCGALFNLGNYSITSTGGTITLQGNPIFITPLRAKVNSSGTLKGLFTSIQSAVNFTSTGYEIVVQSGTFTENFSVTSKTNLIIHGIDAFNSIVNGTIGLYSSSGLNIYNIYCNNLNVSSCTNPTIGLYVWGSGSGTGINMSSTEEIIYKANSRTLKNVAKVANTLKGKKLDDNWDLATIINLTEKSLSSSQNSLKFPPILLRPSREGEIRYGDWYLQDGSHRALGYAMLLLDALVEYNIQEAYILTDKELKIDLQNG